MRTWRSSSQDGSGCFLLQLHEFTLHHGPKYIPPYSYISPVEDFWEAKRMVLLTGKVLDLGLDALFANNLTHVALFRGVSHSCAG